MNARTVNGVNHTEPDTLIGEIARYLAAVDLFRAELCEPTWLPELTRGRIEEERAQVHPALVFPAH